MNKNTHEKIDQKNIYTILELSKSLRSLFRNVNCRRNIKKIPDP